MRRNGLYAAASNPAFDFLKEPEEDVYTSEDGRAIMEISGTGAGYLLFK